MKKYQYPFTSVLGFSSSAFLLAGSGSPVTPNSFFDWNDEEAEGSGAH